MKYLSRLIVVALAAAAFAFSAQPTPTYAAMGGGSAVVVQD